MNSPRVLVSLLLIVLSVQGTCNDITLASVYQLSEKRQLTWVIARDLFGKLPKYSVPDQQMVGLREAIKIATVQCGKKYPGARIALDSASFRQPVASEDRNGVFFYFITFEVKRKRGESFEADVLVLPNGDVLEPQKIPLQQQ